MTGISLRLAVSGILAASSSLFICKGATAQTLSDLTQVCAGCHGDQGVPTEKTTPVIWGQNRDYLLNQLNDFKIGHRKNETMSAVAASLSRTDMEELATYYAKQPWPNLQQPTPPADVQVAAHAVLNPLNCRGCHQMHYQGDMIRPRLAGQQDEYLLKTMTDFHKGERTNYIGMTVLMKSVDEAALKPVAAYLSSLQIAAHPK
ncbi:c-type cytochrome [Hyphomicrobium sp.]|uniref:c-type cytochrome n=1 Tax=Hyphomicrobium sp. TaxID=82 RepID=UPI000FC13F26|nr:c-type cytochrome [Hyphomicrobium sp.]RUP11025.1 MAG: cytochrome C [Hyphomicrobium sp.]